MDRTARTQNTSARPSGDSRKTGGLLSLAADELKVPIRLASIRERVGVAFLLAFKKMMGYYT